MTSLAVKNRLTRKQSRNKQERKSIISGNIVSIFTNNGCLRQAWKNPSSGKHHDIQLNDNGQISSIGGFKIKQLKQGTVHTPNWLRPSAKIQRVLF